MFDTRFLLQFRVPLVTIVRHTAAKNAAGAAILSSLEDAEVGLSHFPFTSIRPPDGSFELLIPKLSLDVPRQQRGLNRDRQEGHAENHGRDGADVRIRDDGRSSQGRCQCDRESPPHPAQHGYVAPGDGDPFAEPD